MKKYIRREETADYIHLGYEVSIDPETMRRYIRVPNYEITEYRKEDCVLRMNFDDYKQAKLSASLFATKEAREGRTEDQGSYAKITLFDENADYDHATPIKRWYVTADKDGKAETDMMKY